MNEEERQLKVKQLVQALRQHWPTMHWNVEIEDSHSFIIAGSAPDKTSGTNKAQCLFANDLLKEPLDQQVHDAEFEFRDLLSI
jgi:hypothetical protein